MDELPFGVRQIRSVSHPQGTAGICLHCTYKSAVFLAPFGVFKQALTTKPLTWKPCANTTLLLCAEWKKSKKKHVDGYAQVLGLSVCS
jgi:hypothetical protein